MELLRSFEYSKFVDFMKLSILAQILGYLHNNTLVTLFLQGQQPWFIDYGFFGRPLNFSINQSVMIPCKC